MGVLGTRWGASAREIRLLERDVELATVEEALAAAAGGSGRLVLVEGHAGIGKSGLVAAAAARAAQARMTVLAGDGAELERGHPFGVVRQLFHGVVAQSSDEERERLLSGAAALASAVLTGTGGSGGAAPGEQTFNVFHGLHWLTANLAEERPLLIAVDDAHWADRATLGFLLYLVQRLADLPVVLMVAFRPAEPDAPVDLLRRLRSGSGAVVLRPAPLSPAAVEELVSARLPSAEEEFADACGRVTGGNPYLLRELLADLDDRGIEPTGANAAVVDRLAPETVIDAALLRLERLPAGAPAIARAVGVLGEDATFARAASLAGIAPAEAAGLVDALVAAEFLKTGEPLAFVHPLLQQAVYGTIPPGERAQAHARAARLIDAGGAPAGALATQLLRAARMGDPWVVERLRSAAQEALAGGAPDAAALYLGRALQEPPPGDLRAQVLCELGSAEALSGSAASVTRFDEALALTGDARERAEVLRQLAWAQHQSGDVVAAVATLERGLAEVADLPPDDTTARLDLVYLQLRHLVGGEDPGSEDRARRLMDAILEKPAADLDAHERGLLAVVALQRLYQCEPHETVVSMFLKAAGDGAVVEDEGFATHTVWHVLGALMWADALDAADALIEKTLAAARREGAVANLAMVSYARAWSRWWRGELAESAADSSAAISAWSGDFSMYLPTAAMWLALAQIELGDIGPAEAVDLHDAEERWGGNALYGTYLVREGVLAFERGEIEHAARSFEAVGESVLGQLIKNPAVIPWRSYLALARIRLGDLEGARRWAREELELAQLFGAARPVGVAQRVAGLAEGGAEGLALLGESVTTLRRSPSAFELAHSLVEHGAALRRDGQRAAARDPLREGLEMAERFGAVVLERQARHELEASGARTHARARTGVAALTPSERRVAELAASGLTNREIAQSLFVTVKAVQWHLGNTYRKLGLGSRAELAGALEGSSPG